MTSQYFLEYTQDFIRIILTKLFYVSIYDTSPDLLLSSYTYSSFPKYLKFISHMYMILQYFQELTQGFPRISFTIRINYPFKTSQIFLEITSNFQENSKEGIV